MIGTILHISWLNLKRDRVSLAMRFLLPVLFFSIFALIFGSIQTGTKESKINVAVVDLDRTAPSRAFDSAFSAQKALAVTQVADLPAARTLVHDGSAAVALVIDSGFSTSFLNFGSPTGAPRVDLLYDAANPVAQNVVVGLVQAAAMSVARDRFIPQFPGVPRPTGGLVSVQATDVRAGEAASQARSMIAYYAAGISVMFLLFSMSAGGGALLDEQESGTLERVLSSNASMTQLLAGKWLFLFINGTAQVTVMFLWAVVAFHLSLFTATRFTGFAAMTLATAAAASAFGLVLATACRTREQLSGISTILILIMSALGGSMIPRFIMPKFMEKTALFTFNGWALDGFLKVFWYDAPGASVGQGLAALMPQLLFLVAVMLVFLAVARTLARRWETL
jgi:ABC-2 type transport system permease protein